MKLPALRIRYVAVVFVTMQIALGSALPVSAQDPADGLFAGVKALYTSSQSKAETALLEDYKGIRRLLDLIVKDYPSSDLAVGILLQETIDGVDIAAINAALEADNGRVDATTVESEAENDIRAGATSDGLRSNASSTPVDGSQPSDSSSFSALSLSSEPLENALKLDSRAVRDIQARLTVLGHEPNGIDGITGKGTRAALSRWQDTHGLLQTGYLNAAQLELLKEESQAELDSWLQDKRNAELYSPTLKRASANRGLKNGWYIRRDGKYCKKVQFGLQYCTPRRPPDA